MPEGSVRNFDEISDRLDQIIATVRSKDTSLERSLDLFDEAIELGSRAVDMVDKFELTPREAAIITLRYGLNGMKPKTQRETAELCGISRSYVSRIEKRALEKLREALGEEANPG